MAHPFVATMIGGLEGCGPSQPWPAVNQHHFTAPTERTPSRESASNGHALVARMIGGGLEGCRSVASITSSWRAIHTLAQHFGGGSKMHLRHRSKGITTKFLNDL